jgi:F-type H+-transporting ATPase subunit delta
MTKVSELASRYARSAFELAGDDQTKQKVLNELRALDKVFSHDKAIHNFLCSPMVKSEDREKVLEAAFQNAGASTKIKQFVMLLSQKGRLELFAQIVQAFENQIDSANGVSRGTVRSAVALSPQERQQLEKIVEQQLNNKVILTYQVDPSVIGGLVAQVGSFTFDDSLESHLRRLNEELKRRAV